MPLDASQKKKMEDWLQQKGIKKCPVCGSANLRVYDRFCGLHIAEPGALLGTGLKTVVVNCDDCALTLLFHAGQIGL